MSQMMVMMTWLMPWCNDHGVMADEHVIRVNDCGVVADDHGVIADEHDVRVDDGGVMADYSEEPL